MAVDFEGRKIMVTKVMAHRYFGAKPLLHQCPDIFYHINTETKRPSLCRRHFKLNFSCEEFCILNNVSLKCVNKCSINNKSADDTPLPGWPSLLTHLCISRS